MSQVTLRWIDEQAFVGVDSSNHAVVVSSQKGDFAIGCKPSDMLLIALGGCTSVGAVGILQKKRQRLEAMEVRLTAVQDKQAPWAFRSIDMHFIVRGTDVSAPAVEQAIRLSEEKYCSVAATLRPQVTITTSFEIAGPQ